MFKKSATRKAVAYDDDSVYNNPEIIAEISAIDEDSDAEGELHFGMPP